jgi:hypothetical protein
MNFLQLALVLALPLIGARASFAASAEADYLAARDAAIATITHGANGESATKAHERALADLEARLRQVIGPIDIKGFPHEGTISLDTLDQADEGFARLDGLVFGAETAQQQVLVTTAGLFDAWLKAHREFREEGPQPHDVHAVLRRDDFYTHALMNGAAVVTYAEIPVAKPAWATLAFAVLDARTQSDPPRVPDEIIITVRGADRVFVVTAKTAIEPGPIAACDDAHARLAKQADDANDADQKSGGKDAALHAKAVQLAHEADWAYPDCFARELRRAGVFPTLARQVQALVDALPER